ncbi:ParB/RepB/Spo0J family partition protein [Gloeocapsopsis crepidinum LEGE 06123]|uniref:ParB/RepB/Spo0J family partition protein n=1 Tax=Gloeocapsopsis crepidinum LEGE 06123 TaxID=588587 RepID=A0ABR9UU82_9CHRO|nr:ParB/RepB/Spo0J family partition protein [Gloeocapsopsis crepidinum]MBE9191866.1 ParB/RepB/Spo0J family partition protein [Gloeocapsopsis crepidinum LEGE 06123]
MSVRKHRSQPYQIKGVDALFGELPLAEVAAEILPLSQIALPQQQPRRYFDPMAMQELVESIRQHGILQPILVRPLLDDKYELVAGERRYRAAVSAGLEEVPVVIRELTDNDALQLALLENLQREDLNPIEETEGILQLIALKLNTTSESAIALLNQAAHPKRNSVDNVIHSKDWQLVQEVFNTVGKFTPESFRTNRLPLLTLPDEVLAALRLGQIAYTKARAIAKVNDLGQRQALLESAIAENLSLTQIKQRVAQIIDCSTNQSDRSQSSSLKNRMDVTYRLAKKSKIWENPKKQKQIEKLLAELEKLFSQD